MARKCTGNPNGRPRKPIDLKEVEDLFAIGSTQQEIADANKVSVDTLTRREGFAESQAAGLAKAKISLRRLQFQSAQSGNVRMLTWLGMQMLGQSNRTSAELSGPGGGPIETTNLAALSDDDLHQLETLLARASQPVPSTGGEGTPQSA